MATKKQVATVNRTVSKRAADKMLGGPTKPAKKAEQGKLVNKKDRTIDIDKLNIAKLKTPKNPAEVADLWWQIRQYRLDEEKRIAEYKAKESELRQWLIDNVPKSLASGVGGAFVSVKVVQKESTRIDDEDAFLKFAHRKGNEDLLVERPNQKAIADRLENGKKVPGVVVSHYADLSYSKL